MSSFFSSKDWRDFEKLIFEMLLGEFGIRKSEINKLTQSSKDGGYDGIFYVLRDGSDEAGRRFYSRMLFEAKLRSSYSNDLPLQDFSKALIISVNKNANRLIIATNLFFTENTIKVLSDYSEKTGLEIQFLNSYDIYLWLEKQKNSSKKRHSNPRLIKFLYESYQNNSHRSQNRSKQNAISMTEQSKSTGTILLGEDRKKLLREAVACIDQAPGIVIIEGEAGIGKTVFTSNLLNEIKEHHSGIKKIDIEYFGTPRILFIKLLENIWNIPFEILNSLDEETVGDMVQWLGDNVIDERMKQTLIAAFCKSAGEYIKYADIFNYYLVEYLFDVYQIVVKRRTLVLCFTNINYANKELLNFLISLLRKFDCKIHIILELRTSIYVDGIVPCEEWNNFINAVFQLPNIAGRFFVSPWNPDELCRFIASLSEPLVLSKESILMIQKRVGDNPLYLSSFISYLKMSTAGCGFPANQIYDYIANCPIENINHTLFLLIEQVSRQRRHTQDILYVLRLMEGRVPRKVFEQLIGAAVMSDLDYILTETPMLQHSQDTVFLSHSLFLEALKNSSSYISKLRRQEIARNLLDKIELLGLDNYHYNVIRINIFCELDSHDEVSKLSASFARELYTLGQFNHSFSYYMLADKHYSKCFDGEDSISEFSCELALGKTECKIKTENFSKDELESDIKECRRLISKVSDNKGKSLTDYAVRVMLLENYFYHYYGEFLQALSITERLLEIAEASDAGRDTEFLGAIWAEYAIAVKETSSLENALQIFRKASKLCPDSHNLRFARLTHLSEKYSSIKPKLAQRYIEMVFPLEPYMDLPEIYHNRVNYAASLFNCHEYERALREAKRIFKDTYTIGLKNEEGRIVNLLGCYHLKKMEYETAYEYFRHGIKIFRSENYIANLWPLLTNTATVHMRLGSYPEALEMVRRCVNIYVDCYGLRISKIMSAENYYEKLYAGVLLVTFYLKRLTKEEYDDAKPLLNKLYKPITSPRILSVLEGLDSEKALARALEHSVYVHDGIVCIKS